MAKVFLIQNELWPYLEIEWLDEESFCPESYVEIPDELLKEFQEAEERFISIQEKLLPYSKKNYDILFEYEKKIKANLAQW